MVYLHFPMNLTEEELMLQAKYQKLKKKKKALQALKAPKQEPEKAVIPKRPTEARDAREIARKLIKSGAIPAIKSPPPQPQNATFKRPRAGRERKLSGPAGSTGGVASYQPFSASQEPPPPEEKTTPRVKYLYDSFVTSREKPEGEKGGRPPAAGPSGTAEAPAPAPVPAPAPKPPQLNTLLVAGTQITEEVVRRRLVSLEPFTYMQDTADEEKVYLIFELPETASRALTTLEGCEEGWRVSVTRRPAATPARTPAAPSPRNPPTPKDAKRTLVSYEDIFD